MDAVVKRHGIQLVRATMNGLGFDRVDQATPDQLSELVRVLQGGE